MPRLVTTSVLFLMANSALAQDANLASSVKEIFRSHCLECHGGPVTRAKVKVFDRDALVKDKRRIIVPGKAEESLLYQLVTAKDLDARMPPAGQPALKAEEIDAVRRWLAAGAPDFPADVAAPVEAKKEAAFKNVAGVDYVLRQILADVRNLKADKRHFTRYFSLNHILAAGVTETELDSLRAAFALAINHLSWQPDLAQPRAVDAPVNSIFAVDIRDLGWDQQPFERWVNGKQAGKSRVNLHDLALLEYPYAAFYESSETFERLLQEFLLPAGQVRPIPYLRIDWFISVMTQPPLYEDMLQLPFDIKELEEKLGADVASNLRDGKARRAGMGISGVSRNNRVVERHAGKNTPYYWKSHDFRSNKGPENIFADPLNFRPAGGEMIFGLPNGLQGYYVANGQGARVDAAPTDIVTDKFASDQVVRNGLACMRCHDRGMKDFADAVRPAMSLLPSRAGLDKRAILDLYAEQKEMDDLVQRDRERFEKAVQALLEKRPADNPLVRASKRFLDDPIHLLTAAGELGLADPRGLEIIFKLPQFVGLGLIPLADHGPLRRDAWEDYHDQVVRNLGLGEPIVPLDGLLRRDFPAGPPPFNIELKTNRKNNIVEPGDEIALFVVNRSEKSLYIELLASGARGDKAILTPASTIVKPGETYRYPSGNATLKVRGGLGKDQVTVYASQTVFPPGELLRGKGVTDRVVHRFYEVERKDGRLLLKDQVGRMVKRTIEIETR